MYENITYELLLKRMLDKIPDKMDKREGSIIYDAIAPCAIELQLMYIELDVILKETFGDTATRQYLVLRAEERGIKPVPASFAILKADFNVDVPMGSRFNGGDLNYVVVEKIEGYSFKLQCETIGVVGNKAYGELTPINYIQGLTQASLSQLLIPGEDDEDTELFRSRYLNSFDVRAYGGNVADYLDKTNSLPGVGSTKVTPIWNGGGTVKLTILDSEFNIASAELVNVVQQQIDPTQNGHGIGIAPIGHVVTVSTTENITIDIATSIIFEDGYYFNDLKQLIEDSIADYLFVIRKEWANIETSIVRIAQIESRVMNIKGVLDISRTKINNSATNLILTAYQTPILGVITND